MENEINIALIGRTPIESHIGKDSEVSICFKRTAISKIVEDPSNNEITYKLKNLGEVVIIEGDKTIAGKPKKSSQSQVLRNKLYSWYQEQWAGGGEFQDFDKFYAYQMSKFINEINEKLI